MKKPSCKILSVKAQEKDIVLELQLPSGRIIIFNHHCELDDTPIELSKYIRENL